jgi:plastocyanin
MPRPTSIICALAAAGLLLAGCGGSSGGGSSSSSSAGAGGGGYGASTQAQTQTSASSSSSSSSTSRTAIAIAAQERNGLSFSKKALTAKAGRVTIAMANPSSDSLPHAIAIEGNGVSQSGATVQPGDTSKVSLDLKPGSYTFFCPVPGHRQAGMEGTLTVR